MPLRESITTESWIEDVQFALGVFLRGEPQQLSARHMRDYLSNRYQPDVAILESLAVQASYNWLVSNWEEIGDIGLRVSGGKDSGVVNALLFALHNLVFSDPRPSWWAKVPSIVSQDVIRVAQTFVDAEKNQHFALQQNFPIDEHP